MALTRGPVRGLEHLPQDRCLVMGIVNVTPDSFSDGGLWADPERAVDHAVALTAQGADLIDLGAESTRPGAAQVDGEEQLRRLLPVIRELAARNILISVDTTDAHVAAESLAAGAGVINDVSGGLADPGMLDVVAGTGVPYVLMHWRGHSVDMNSRAVYTDVVADVCREIDERLEAFIRAGGRPEQVVVDPGLGFAKDASHNWQLIHHITELGRWDLPILVGASRKRFLGELLAADHRPSQPQDRDGATAALTALMAARGAWAVRVHDVRASADAVRVVAAAGTGGVQ